MASIKVEIDLLNSGSWTDITTFVDSASIRRGRTDETNTVSPGTLTLDVYNDNGRFTPGLSSGAFYPNIKPNRNIRVSTVTTGTVAVFTGKIDAIDASWDGGVRPVATITATDGFKGLQRRTSQSFYTETVLAAGGLSSIGYYPLTEPATAQTFGSLAPTNLPGVAVEKDSKYGGGTITPGQGAGFLKGAPSTTYCDFTFTGTGNLEHMSVIQVSGGAAKNGPVLPRSGNWTFGCWFKKTSNPADRAVMLFACSTYSSTDPVFGLLSLGASLFVDAAGKVNFSITNTLGVETLATSASAYTDGLWHYVTGSLASDKQSMTLLVDSTSATATMGTALSGLFPNLEWVVAGGQLSPHGDSRYGWGGSLANLEFYTGVDSSLSHGIRSLFGAFGYYLSNGTDNLVVNVAQNFGYGLFAAPFVVADTGLTTNIASFDQEGSTYLGILQTAEKTEQGLLFIRGDGSLVFKNRAYRVNQTSAFTLNAANQEVAPDFQVGSDDQMLFNDYAATRPGGAVIRVRDVATSSIADNGVYTNAASDSGADSILVTTDAEVQSYANFKVTNYSQPQPRTPQITVDLKRASDLFPTVQNVDIGVRFTVINLPAEAPASSMDYIAESVNWSFSGRTDTWTLVMNTSPAGNTQYFVWDDPVYGKFDSNNSWFY